MEELKPHFVLPQWCYKNTQFSRVGIPTKIITFQLLLYYYATIFYYEDMMEDILIKKFIYISFLFNFTLGYGTTNIK